MAQNKVLMYELKVYLDNLTSLCDIFKTQIYDLCNLLSVFGGRVQTLESNPALKHFSSVQVRYTC